MELLWLVKNVKTNAIQSRTSLGTMKYFNYFFLIVILSSCSTSIVKKEYISEYNIVCDCLDSINSEMTIEKVDFETMKCITNVSGENRDSFFIVLDYCMQNCPNFIKVRNELEMKIYGIDTLNFNPVSDSECKAIFNGKWKDALSNLNSYSIRNDNLIEFYENEELISIWKILKHENCRTTYLVTKESIENKLPPHVDDTVTWLITGHNDSLIQGIFSYGQMEIKSIGIKLK